jgi:hypothetical protein
MSLGWVCNALPAAAAWPHLQVINAVEYCHEHKVAHR